MGLRSLPGQVSDKTLDSYINTVRLHLVPALGRKVLRKLTVAEVDQLLTWKREQGYSPSSVRIIRAVLRRALHQAEREGLVLRNVAALWAAPRIRSNEGRALSIPEAQNLLAEASRTRHEALITVMLAFGLRRGEALGLHWSRLDWSTATLKVTHGVKRVQDRTAGSDRRTRLVIGELKTARSRRTLFLTPQVVEMLRRHRARQAEERIAVGEAWEDHGLIFPSEIGSEHRWTPTTCRTRFRGSVVALDSGTGTFTSFATPEHR